MSSETLMENVERVKVELGKHIEQVSKITRVRTSDVY